MVKNATHEGVLKIGNSDLDVAVLEDGTRVITLSAVFKALDRPVRGNSRLINIPVFMDAQNLQPFVNAELMEVINKIDYIGLNGTIREGYNALILPLVSDLYLRAREAGVIKQSQLVTAQKAEILVRSLAKIGITALVDEATGYQYDREQFELQKILSAYVSEEVLKWQKTFDIEFYKEIFRLWDIPFAPPYIRKKPQFIGTLTNKYIYEQLPHGKEMLAELKQKSERREDGRYKYKFHQSLTPEVGREALKKQIHEVTALMSISDNRKQFQKLFDKKYSTNFQLSLFDDIEEENQLPQSDFNKSLIRALEYSVV